MRRMLILTSAAVLLAGLSTGSAWAKTPKECNAEYSANKDAIKGAGQKKKDFIAACKAGTETVPAGTAAAPAPAQAAAPAAPAPAAPPASAPTTTRAAKHTAPTATPAAPAANQFPTEAGAMARCPGQTVVWLNTKSGVYHFATNKNYGHTKAGAYMCETDATAAGERASKEEKHP